MPMREIDETELLANQQVVKAVQGMLGNPEARQLLLKAQKIINPQAVIPEIDAKKPVEDELEKLRQEMAADRKARQEEKEKEEAERKAASFRDSWEKQKRALADQGYTDEGIKKIEEHAEKEGIPNLRAAAADFDRLNPPAAPVQSNGALGFDIFNPPADDAEDMKAMVESRGESDSALNKLIGKALTDIRGTR